MSIGFDLRRPSRICLVVLLLASAGTACEDPPLPPLTEAQHREVLADCPTQAYCLRGLIDVYSLGLNHLADRLMIEGIDAQVLNHMLWPVVAESILADSDAGTLVHPIVLVGHSYGSDDSIRIAEYLQPFGIEIDLIILLDATFPPPVPDNVGRCLHLYQPTSWGDTAPDIFPGNPVYAAPGNTRTDLSNRRIDSESFGDRAIEIHHFNVDSSLLIHDLVMEEIVQQCAESG